MTMRTSRRQARRHTSGLRVLAVLVLAAAVGAGVYFLVVRGSGGSKAPSSTAAASAVAVSQQGLGTLASLGRPIYWAGPKPADTYELTQTPDGRIYVRYLPAGVAVGSTNIYLTVATYALRNAFAVTRTAARQAGTVKIPVANGGIAFYRKALPTNVYVAYPGSQYQIEVFDPSATAAHELVASGGIAKVPAAPNQVTAPKETAEAASPADLVALATRLGRNVYWAGAKAGFTYELTQTPDGRVYVRYLPAGVKVGSKQKFLTIGTYPLSNAYTTTKQASKQPGAVSIPVTHGIAFYNTKNPESVYVAFPGVDEQIEVFDPSASAGHRTVQQREIAAVS